MIRTLRTLLVGALTLAVAMVGATPAGAKSAGTDRPFDARGDGIAINAGPFPAGCDFTNSPEVVCPQELLLDFIGTNIGRGTFSSAGQYTVHLDQQCTAANGSTGFEVDVFQEGEIVAANGDELWFESSYGGCNEGVGTLFEPVGTYTIRGGTGRFDDATGTGTVKTSTPGDGLTISNRWSGSITY